MKKQFLRIVTLLVCSIMLVSCNPRQSDLPMAEQISQKADQAMSRVKSYRTDMEMHYSFFVDDTKMRGTLNGILIEDQGKGRGDYYYYSETSHSLTVGSIHNPTKTRILNAYYDGTAFSSVTQGKTIIKLCSPMSASGYRKYQLQHSAVADVDYTNCKNVSYSTSEDGYTLTYSGYDPQDLLELLSNSGLDEQTLGAAPDDMNVVLEIDDQYLPISISMEMVFVASSPIKEPPTFEIYMEFSEFNQAQRITNTIELEDYTKIPDLRLLDGLEKLIYDRIKSRESSFTYVTNEELNTKTTVRKSNMQGGGTCYNTKDGFECDILISSESVNRIDVEYSNGELNLFNGRRYDDQKMDDEQAQEYVYSLLALGYDPASVVNIEKTKHGYLVTMLSTKSSAPAQSLSQSGIQYDSGTYTIEFVIKWGKLSSVTSNFFANCSLSGVSLTYESVTSVAFD